MSLSNISRAKMNESKPRLLEVKSLFQVPEPPPEAEAPQPEENPEIILQEKLESLQREIMRLEQEMDQKKAEFQAQLENERQTFENGLEEERKKTIERSFSEGFTQGEKAGLEAWQEKLNQAKVIINQAEHEAKKYIEQSETVILGLAMQVAEKVIGQTIENVEDAFSSLVKQAVKEMREENPIKIIVSPNRYERTVQKMDEIRDVTYGSQVLLFADETMADHDCRIESPSGQLDASVRTQLRQLAQAIKAMMEEA